jgi:hypothetical protein
MNVIFSSLTTDTLISHPLYRRRRCNLSNEFYFKCRLELEKTRYFIYGANFRYVSNLQIDFCSTKEFISRNTVICIIGHLPPKGKAPVRRLSTPKSVDEERSEIEDETLNRSESKKSPQTTIQRGEQHLSQAQIHKRPPVSESKYSSSGTSGNKTASSIFKLTEPPAPASKSRVTQDLDEKWSDMFGTNKQEDSAKEDLLSKLIADEQQERRQAAAQPPPSQRPSMTMFESSTRSTTSN